MEIHPFSFQMSEVQTSLRIYIDISFFLVGVFVYFILFYFSLILYGYENSYSFVYNAGSSKPAGELIFLPSNPVSVCGSERFAHATRY